MAADSDIDPVILDQAAGWLVALRSGETDDQQWQALARWRQQSPAHAEAWRRAERMLDAFDQLPPQLGRETLKRLRQPRRRRALRAGLVLLAVPAAWLAWRQTAGQPWRADLRTAVGQQRTVALADGTRLVLNTDSAVNVLYSAGERRLQLLAGEILVTTGKDAGATRPFFVETSEGRLRPLGTRFSVRDTGGGVRAAVFEGAVEVQPHAAAQRTVVRAGQQIRFSAHELSPVQPVEESALLWQRGMLLARGMRLDALLAELGRYQHGVLRCDPAVAGLAVSGAFPLHDVNGALALLEKTMPVRVARTTPYWIWLRPR